MIAVLGVTGQVGSVVAETLMEEGHKVRAMVRDAAKGAAWRARGAEIVIADITDGGSLIEAWHGCEGVFIVAPPSFAPAEGFPEVRALAREVVRALESVRPRRVVVLSTVGAHRTHGIGILEQLHLLEEELKRTGLPMTFVRAGWFMENAKWDLEDARKGTIASYLQPLDRPVPMVSTHDVGRVCARCFKDDVEGVRVLEVEGPQRYSPNDLATAFGLALGHEVRALAVPRAEWQSRFEAQGMPSDRTAGRIEMIEGFNSGWIDFEGAPERGQVSLNEAVAEFAQ